MRYMIGLLLTMVSLVPAGAADKFDPEARARAVAPYLDEQAVAIVHVDLQRLDVDALLNRVAELGLVDMAELTEPKHMASAIVGGLQRAGARDVYAVISLADLPRVPVLVFPIHEKTNVDALIGVCQLAQIAGHEKIGGALVCGSKPAVERITQLKASPRPELAKAFAAAGDTAVQALFLPTADMRRLLEETLPQLPKELGGGPVTTLTRGVQWAAVGLDLPPKASARFTTQAPDAKQAVEVKQLLNNVLVLLSQREEVVRAVPNFADIVPLLSPQVEGNRLTLTLDDKKPGVSRFLQGLGQKVKDAAQDARSQNNLKEIGIGMHTYANEHKNEFPLPAIVDKNGKPLLSWRVRLLPYVNQENLYKQFRLDEPWDSEHNKKLIDIIPAAYASPSLKGKKGMTTYLAPIGDDTLFGGKLPVRLQDIKDGTSNTILLVDVVPDQAVIWTKPDDWKFDPQNPTKGLLAKDQKSFLILFADGVARPISSKIDAATLKALFTRSGGEAVGAIP